MKSLYQALYACRFPPVRSKVVSSIVLPCLVMKLLLSWGVELRGPTGEISHLEVKAVLNAMRLSGRPDCRRRLVTHKRCQDIIR